MMTTVGLSYKEQLQQTFDEFEACTKRLCSLVTQHRDARVKSASVGDKEVIEALCRGIKLREERLRSLLEQADQRAAQAAEVRRLEQESAALDKKLDKVMTTLKEAETSLINAVFKGNEKLKSIRHAEARRVDIDKLISLAHRQALSNGVAAPIEWRPGDPMRPYPTEHDLRRGWLGAHGHQHRMRVEMETPMMNMPPHMHLQRGPAPPGAQWASPQRHPMNPMMGGMPQSPQQSRVPFPGAAMHMPQQAPVRAPFPSAQSAPSPHMPHFNPMTQQQQRQSGTPIQRMPFPSAAGTVPSPYTTSMQTASPAAMLQQQRQATLPQQPPSAPQGNKRRLSESSSSSSSNE